VTIDSAQKACIFCCGRLRNSASIKRITGNCDLLIATTGGAKHLAVLGRQPEIVIGDMDSVGVNEWKNDDNILKIPYSPDKNKSDVELAVEYALKHECREIFLIAAVGDRLDYTLSNVALVAGNPGRIAILDGASTLIAVDKSEKCILHGQVGTLVSLIPYGPGPFKVRTKGLKYSLEDELLHSATYGLSNELSQTQACVCVSNGVLLVYVENEDSFC
jgi:thiamine pyrophosphokinase